MSAYMLPTHQLQRLAKLANLATGRPPESCYKLLALCNRKSLRHLYGPSAERLIVSAQSDPESPEDTLQRIYYAPDEALASLIKTADYQFCEAPGWQNSAGRFLLLETLWMLQMCDWRSRMAPPPPSNTAVAVHRMHRRP